MLPLARSAWDRKGGRALERYGKRLMEEIDQMTPWAEGARYSSLLRRKRMADQGITDPRQTEKGRKAKQESAALWATLQKGVPIEG